MKNKDTGRTYDEVQAAVRSAKAGDHLVVRGQCGRVVIKRNLKITGVKTQRHGRPVLSGAGRTRVVIINNPAAEVKIRNLAVANGRNCDAAGIHNEGDLVLHDVVVRNNRLTSCFMGYEECTVCNYGALRLNGSSRIVGNRDGSGVALGNLGTVVMNGVSSIRANAGDGVRNRGSFVMNATSSIARHYNGVYNHGTFTMNGSSTIARNKNGGLFNRGTFTMNGSSSVSGNAGVGLYNHEGGALVGATCGPGGNVDGNTADCRAD